MEETKITQEEKKMIEDVVDLEIETKELLTRIDDAIEKCTDALNV